MTDLPPLDPAHLPTGVRARFLPEDAGLRVHILEAGFETPGRPLVLLLHGFPELAFSWRHILPALAQAGYHAVAPDQRGYGRTTGWADGYGADLAPFRMLNLARDALGVVAGLGYRQAAAVAGHDFGSPVAAWCALTRPDVFRRVALMSAPFTGPPTLHAAAAGEDIHAALAKLDPPRLHYQWYFSTAAANAQMHRPPQGLHAFLRGYYHMKSGDWPGNRPFELSGWTAAELARLPAYYIMHRDRTMPQTVAQAMPMPEQSAACPWLPDSALAVYAQEYARTGFQGGLNWYRCRTEGTHERELALFAGRTIDGPSLFVAGARDWGIQQVPGALARMQHSACTALVECHLIDGAGHWVQQERPAETTAALLRLLAVAVP